MQQCKKQNKKKKKETFGLEFYNWKFSDDNVCLKDRKN